jgi:hypothetical protein
MKLPIELGMTLLIGSFSVGAFAYVQDRPAPTAATAHDHHGHHAGPRAMMAIAVTEGSPRLHRAAAESLDETRAQIHLLKAHQVGAKTCLEDEPPRPRP